MTPTHYLIQCSHPHLLCTPYSPYQYNQCNELYNIIGLHHTASHTLFSTTTARLSLVVLCCQHVQQRLPLFLSFRHLTPSLSTHLTTAESDRTFVSMSKDEATPADIDPPFSTSSSASTTTKKKKKKKNEKVTDVDNPELRAQLGLLKKYCDAIAISQAPASSSSSSSYNTTVAVRINHTLKQSFGERSQYSASTVLLALLFLRRRYHQPFSRVQMATFFSSRVCIPSYESQDVKAFCEAVGLVASVTNELKYRWPFFQREGRTIGEMVAQVLYQRMEERASQGRNVSTLSSLGLTAQAALRWQSLLDDGECTEPFNVVLLAVRSVPLTETIPSSDDLRGNKDQWKSFDIVGSAVGSGRAVSFSLRTSWENADPFMGCEVGVVDNEDEKGDRVLFHATRESAVGSILEQIKLESPPLADGTDFGRHVFYLTRSIDQAKEWCRKKSKGEWHTSKLAIVKYVIPQSLIPGGENKKLFPAHLSDDDYPEWASVIHAGRTKLRQAEQQLREKMQKWQWVEGPMLKEYYREQMASMQYGGHQIGICQWVLSDLITRCAVAVSYLAPDAPPPAPTKPKKQKR
jgi:hypothetical protein